MLGWQVSVASRVILTVLAVPALSVLLQGGGTKETPGKAATLADYLQVRRVRGASFSFDEKRVAFLSDADGRLDLWVKPVKGGAAARITNVQGVIHSFAFSPTKDELIYEVDEGGNDAPRLYLTNHEGKGAVEIAPDFPQGSRIGFIRWSPDGRSLLFITNLPKEDFTTVWEYKTETRERRAVWKSDSKLSFSMASPDLRLLIAMEVLSDVNFNLYLVEQGEAPVLLTPHQGDVAYTPTGFSANGEELLYTSTADGEFATLHAMNLSTRRTRLVHRADWDVEAGDTSPGGRYFYTVANHNGLPEVRLEDRKAGRQIALPSPGGAGAMVPVSFSPRDNYVMATLTTDTTPEAPYLIDLTTRTIERVADVLPPSLQNREMQPGRRVRVSSFDGLSVPALVYTPPGKGPFPAVVEIHGGPVAQAKQTYSGIRQYLVSKGYVVMVPNVRGSSGYGKTYTTLDNMDLGGAPLKDVIACKEWLVSNAGADSDRVAIMGASYGGYMALAAAAFSPSTFAAHVDFFGISDFRSLIASYPPYWASYSSFLYKKYGDPKNPDHAKYQHDRSPLHFADRIERPLLVVQGENDAKVPRSQSEKLVAAMRDRSRPVEYLVIPGEGHGFSKNASRLKAYQAAEAFLETHLKAPRRARR